MLTQLLALTAVFALAVAITIGTMILGYGLWPKSWWWVIGLGVFGHIFAKVLIDRVVKEIKP